MSARTASRAGRLEWMSLSSARRIELPPLRRTIVSPMRLAGCLPRSTAARVGGAAVAMVLAAELAVWLLSTDDTGPKPDPVSESAYFTPQQLERADDFRGGQRWLLLLGLALVGGAPAARRGARRRLGRRAHAARPAAGGPRFTRARRGCRDLDPIAVLVALGLRPLGGDHDRDHRGGGRPAAGARAALPAPLVDARGPRRHRARRVLRVGRADRPLADLQPVRDPAA